MKKSNNRVSVNKNVGLSVVLSENSDVFPDELSKDLPPMRANEDSKIELKEGA